MNIGNKISGWCMMRYGQYLLSFTAISVWWTAEWWSIATFPQCNMGEKPCSNIIKWESPSRSIRLARPLSHIMCPRVWRWEQTLNHRMLTHFSVKFDNLGLARHTLGGELSRYCNTYKIACEGRCTQLVAGLFPIDWLRKSEHMITVRLPTSSIR